MGSEICIEPDEGRPPLQASPATPPDAVHAVAFCASQERVTLSPTVWVLALLVKVTAGAGAAVSVEAGAV